MTVEKKNAYLAELRRLLATLPAEERETALTYYEEYFADAGSKESERIFAELGPPKTLAEQILSGYGRDYLDSQPKSSSTHVPARPEDAAKARREEEEARVAAAQAEAEHARLAREQTHASSAKKENTAYTANPNRSGPSVLLIVFLTLLALPLLLPLVIVIFSLIFALAALIFGLGIGAGALVLAMLAGGIATLVAGFAMLPISGLEALLSCGVGLALLGSGCIMLLICVFMLVKVVPAIFRFSINVLRWPFERRVSRA
ncbi:MAG: DUF1700 domain-containing protein [Clostridiales bacterium]|nr:DUF1700 domain-containing protein [Clostridiales bacterium]